MSIVKMPSDLFLYQEILTAHQLGSVLEIGYGDGGGLWFFATMLALLGGGVVVGVDPSWSAALSIRAQAIPSLKPAALSPKAALKRERRFSTAMCSI